MENKSPHRPSQAVIDPVLLTTKQAAKIMGYDNTVSWLRLVHAEGIPHVRLNRNRIMFTREGLDAFMESRTVGGKRK